MKRTSDGTHEPGMRRAGAPDAPAEVSQAELDVLAAQVAVIQDQLPVYSAQLTDLSEQMAQRKDALIRVGTGVDLVMADIGPRYMLQPWRMTAPGPGDATVLQIKTGDVVRSVVKYRDLLANTQPLEENSPDLLPGTWNAGVIADGLLQQLDSSDFSLEVGTCFLGFFERPDALKRTYLLKAVAGAVGAGPIVMTGALVGDTVYTLAGDDIKGSIARYRNDGNGIVVEPEPWRAVPLNPDTDLFETTVTVDGEIQQIHPDLSGKQYLFFLCRGAGEADAPRDYFLSMTIAGSNGAGACTCPRALPGDVVESVFKATGAASLAHRFAQIPNAVFEPTISIAAQIQQVGVDDLSFDALLIFFSRPASVPTPGTPAPILLEGAQQNDVIESAFVVDQTTGELVELRPVSAWFQPTVMGSGEIVQVGGQLAGRSIAFLLKRAYPDP